MSRHRLGETGIADVDAVRRVYTALMHGGPSELLDRYDELLTADFEWHPALLGAFRKRAFRGREEFAEYWREFNEGFEGPALGDAEFEALGSGRVLGTGRLAVKGVGSGVPIDQEVAYLFEVRDGRVSYGRTFFSRREAEEFLTHA